MPNDCRLTVRGKQGGCDLEFRMDSVTAVKVYNALLESDPEYASLSIDNHYVRQYSKIEGQK